MLRIKKLSLKKKISSFFLITSFIIFLYPYSISGLSANYSFILFPLFLILLTGKVKKPSNNVTLTIVFFFLIFIISAIYQSNLFQHLDRRFLSFIIFMTLFSYVVIDIDKHKIEAFKIAVVLIVLYFAVQKIGKFFIYTLIEDYGNLKFYVGSSRYGYVYLLAFWITMLYKPPNKLIQILKLSVIILILGGIFITYSRTTIVALLSTFGLYYFSNIFLIKKKLFFKLAFIFLIPITFIVLVNLLEKLFPNTSLYFSRTLFTYFSLDGFYSLIERFGNVDSSEGFRINLWGKILHYVSLSPFIGSGFLGCWIMFNDMECSAHNQYADVLFRVGFIGFYLYLLILFQVFKYLKNHHRDLLYGFIGMLIYGFFHETFKFSQGAFILTFLFGMMITEHRNNNAINR
tara:strand:+ start:930 stop:2135 length:1206 start_codon:yes stop_codon:yes gene_type:complete